jgi:cytochrome oxidase Cu insertion factor (SCO1/SenC/PrrC family)
MRKRPTTRFAGLAGALAGLVAVPCAAVGAAGQPMIGEPAPPFRLTDLQTGQPLGLEDLRGKIVVLHFGASW